jgi:hypothetical protein
MTFSEFLSGFIGKTVEIFSTTQFFTGVLLFVGDGTYTVNVVDPFDPSPGPPAPMTFFNSTTQFLRILV